MEYTKILKAKIDTDKSKIFTNDEGEPDNLKAKIYFKDETKMYNYLSLLSYILKTYSVSGKIADEIINELFTELTELHQVKKAAPKFNKETDIDKVLDERDQVIADGLLLWKDSFRNYAPKDGTGLKIAIISNHETNVYKDIEEDFVGRLPRKVELIVNKLNNLKMYDYYYNKFKGLVLERKIIGTQYLRHNEEADAWIFPQDGFENFIAHTIPCLESSLMNIEQPVALSNDPLIPSFYYYDIANKVAPDESKFSLIKEWLTNYFRPDQQEVLEQFFASILIGKNRGRQALWVHDVDGASLKSKITNAAVNALGDAASGMQAEQFDDKHVFSKTFGKRLIYIGDNDKKGILHRSVFKSILGGDTASAEGKGQKSFSVDGYAKVIITSNYAPEISDALHSRTRVLYLRMKTSGELSNEYKNKYFETIDGEFKKELDGSFNVKVQVGTQERLNNEMPYFFQYCLSKWADLMSVKEHILWSEEMASDVETFCSDPAGENFEEIWSCFEKDSEGYISKNTIAGILEKGLKDTNNHSVSKFETWLKNTKGLKIVYANEKQNREVLLFYPGMSSIRYIKGYKINVDKLLRIIRKVSRGNIDDISYLFSSDVEQTTTEQQNNSKVKQILNGVTNVNDKEINIHEAETIPVEEFVSKITSQTFCCE